MISEIEYALTLGYQLLTIHELHVYTNQDFILKPFIEHLNFLKTKYSDLFESCMSKDAKENYCTLLNSEMNYCSPLKLTVNNVSPNIAKRNFYKLAANSFFGKFAQHRDLQKLNFVSNQADLEELLVAETINDIFSVNENLCIVSTAKNKLKAVPSLKYNVYIGSQITAFARQQIHQHIMTLSQIPGCTIFHVNCDSLYFSLPLTSKCPFVVNHSVGNFKHIYKGEILSYFSFGPRQYCVAHKDLKGLVIDTHISGLSLKNSILSSSFDAVFANFLQKYEKKITETLIFYPNKKKVNLGSFQVKTYSQKFTLKNNLSKRRYVLLETYNLQTHPFGLREN